MRRLIPALAGGAIALALLAGTASAKSYTTKGAWSFVSAPGVNPPKLKVVHRHGKLAQGQFLLANFKDLVLPGKMVGQGGPLIVNSRLQPVWFRPTVLSVHKQGSTEIGSNSTLNLHEQSYEGKPVLSWWQGSITAAGDTLSGEDTVVNQHYQTVATLSAPKTPITTPATCAEPNPWILTEHEFLIQGQNAWVTAYSNVPMNLTKYGGPAHGAVIDSSVQEYDLQSGKLEYCWDALKNIPLSDSHSKPLSSGVWDAYHENSISLGPDGTFLVSMRNDWAAYDVNQTTNKILWTIGGDPKLAPAFKLPSNGRFEWQHDVELHSGNVVSVFDDHCCDIIGSGKLAPPTGPASRGLTLKLNFAKHTATRTGDYTLSSNAYSAFLGNTQLLPNGNVSVGWGTQPFVSEYAKSGKLLLDASLPNPDLSYRSYVQSWVGLPLTPPSGAVRESKGKTTVYASWNGATRLVAWRVLAGSNKSSLKTVVKHAKKTGFETAIAVPGSHKAFEVEALSSSGKVLGTSKLLGHSGPTLHGGY